MSGFRDTWTDQCEAAENICERFGLEKGIGYLVGEKFLNAIRAAPRHPEVAAELPAFAARIREIIDPQELRRWFTTVRRVGPLGHAASEEQFQTFVAAGAVEENPVTSAEEILALERARELLNIGDAHA